MTQHSDLSIQLTKDISKLDKHQNGIFFTSPKTVSQNIEYIRQHLKNVKTEHTFESGSSDSLMKLILKYAREPKMINNYISEMPEPVTVEMYVDQLIQTYKLI